MPACRMTVPKRAMVLAAGRGERMRPITDTIPKPLVEVGGRSMLDRVLDKLADTGVEAAVVNTHHLGERIAERLRDRERPRILLSPEEERLETGGGVVNALPKLGGDPFYVVNADILWLDGPDGALHRLARAWNESDMDALLLLHPTVGAAGYDGAGDYFLDPVGQLRRRSRLEIAPFLFAGIQIVHPRLFDRAPPGAFSLNLLYDRAQAAGRLYGLRHDGEWFHIGTPESLAEAEERLHERYV